MCWTCSDVWGECTAALHHNVAIKMPILARCMVLSSKIGPGPDDFHAYSSSGALAVLIPP